MKHPHRDPFRDAAGKLNQRAELSLFPAQPGGVSGPDLQHGVWQGPPFSTQRRAQTTPEISTPTSLPEIPFQLQRHFFSHSASTSFSLSCFCALLEKETSAGSDTWEGGDQVSAFVLPPTLSKWHICAPVWPLLCKTELAGPAGPAYSCRVLWDVWMESPHLSSKFSPSRQREVLTAWAQGLGHHHCSNSEPPEGSTTSSHLHPSKRLVASRQGCSLPVVSAQASSPTHIPRKPHLLASSCLCMRPDCHLLNLFCAYTQTCLFPLPIALKGLTGCTSERHLPVQLHRCH